MNKMTQLVTPAARELMLASDPRSEGEPPTLETYRSPDGQVEIACATDEREEWEADSGLELDSDTPDADTFASLRAYLTANFALCDADAPARFVWTVGAYAEAYPDVPADLPLCLWDRKTGAAVVTISERWANAMALERNTAATAPFTNLADWFNGLSPVALDSEVLPV